MSSPRKQPSHSGVNYSDDLASLQRRNAWSDDHRGLCVTLIKQIA